MGDNQNVGATCGSPVTRGSPVPKMKLNKIGKIVDNIWNTLPDHHPVELDTFQIMPNHVHFILGIVSGGSRPAPTLGTIVGLFKSECTKQIRRSLDDPNIKIWQRNFWEHVVRDDKSLDKIRGYITTNPKMWPRDRNNPENMDYHPRKSANNPRDSRKKK
jgi:REP element-mobilizing transposase RayT